MTQANRLKLLSFSFFLITLFTIQGTNTMRADDSILPPGDLGLPPANQCHSIGDAGTPYETGINCRLLLVDGYPRTFIVLVPPVVQRPAPVVFMFHGSSGDGYQYLQISGWAEKGIAEGFITIFPTGLRYCKKDHACEDGGNTGWTSKWSHYHLPEDSEFNLEVKLPDYPEGAAWPADDVQFTRLIMDDLDAAGNNLTIDPERTYASGFSSGASFTARLAVELADRLTAVGYVSGGLIDVTDPENEPASPVAHIPVYAAFGNADTGMMDTVGWDPGDGPLPLDPDELLDIDGLVSSFILPHLDGFEHQHNAHVTPDNTAEAPLYTRIRWQTSRGREADHIFQLAVLAGLEHKYPNGCHDKNPNCFVAADIFWSFFESGPGWEFGQ